MQREFKIMLKDGCSYCMPRIEELLKIFEDFENNNTPKDFELILILRNDWLGEKCFHLKEVKINEILEVGRYAKKS